MVANVSENPLKFIPESPENCLQAYLDSFDEGAKTLHWVASILKNSYEKMKVSSRIDREEVLIFLGRREVMAKVQEILPRAEKLVSITSCSTGLILAYKFLDKALDEVLERGVKIQIYAPYDFYSRNIVKELRQVCEVRRSAIKLPIFLVFIDEKEFLLAKLVSKDPLAAKEDADGDIGIHSTNPSLCKLFSDIFSGQSLDELDTIAKPSLAAG